jgi:hypothetical protein
MLATAEIEMVCPEPAFSEPDAITRMFCLILEIMVESEKLQPFIGIDLAT